MSSEWKAEHCPHPVKIRSFRPGDEPALFRVYFTSIHQIAARDYSPEQIAAWAPADFDTDLWAARVRKLDPFVVELDNQIVGYADIQPDGYIDHFYVSGFHARQGIGTLLMGRIHEEAAMLGTTALTSNVSKTAEPFFARHGFQVVERHFPVCRGVVLENALMRKGLGSRQSPKKKPATKSSRVRVQMSRGQSRQAHCP